MGIKKDGEEKKGPEETGEEDTPFVKDLKKLDEEYLVLANELEKKCEELQREYLKKQQPLLVKRAQMLSQGNEENTGTPALKGFWTTALRNLTSVAECTIEDHDDPILDYLTDIKSSYLDDNTSFDKGFRLHFCFAENPYFAHKELVKEYHCSEQNKWNKAVEVEKIIVTPSQIEWKPGKDVTVQESKKKDKKKKKSNKESKATTMEPRDSFFRNFFQNLSNEDGIPDGIQYQYKIDAEEEDEEEDEEEWLSMFMDNDHEFGVEIKDTLIPYAAHCYTGEACPDEDDYDDDDLDDDDEDEEEEDEDDEDDEDDDGAKKGKKKSGKGGGKGDKKDEECKQQ